MKKLYILIPLLLLFISATSYGQKIRFTDTSNKWHYVYKYLFNLYWSPVKGSITGTTIQNGITYSIYEGSNDSALVRFDTTTNKVYTKIYRNSYYPLDTNEFVLYDFNANVGDSLKTPYHNYIVRTKDSININGTKHYTFQIDNGLRLLTIIEGIGSINDPLMPYLGFFFEWQQRLVCFQNNGTYPTLSVPYTYMEFDNNISCKDTNGVDVKNIPINRQGVTISPNPANQYSKITFPYTIQSGRLTITDVLGKTICSKSITNKTEIAIGEMPASGFYLYQLTDLTQNQSYTGKFIYE